MRRFQLLFTALIMAAMVVAGCADDADHSSDVGLGILDGSTNCGHDSGNPDIQVFSETVTCAFTGATSLEACRTSYFGPACKGKGSCAHKISGYVGQKHTWQSSCGGTATTVTDGKDEAVSFSCTPGLQDTDKVTCLFVGSSTQQSCSSIKGSCKGTTSCTVTVKANTGAVLDWSSSCGGRRALTVDGKDDQASFSCGSATAAETVTCVFKGSNAQHSCFAANLPGYTGCKGTGSCQLKVSGKTGQGVTWKSTCGGYAYTVIDGKDENAEFSCK